MHSNLGFYRGLWNEEKRFHGLDFLTSSSLIVYVGGNTEGKDGKVLLERFNSSIIIYEPVPAFFGQLQQTWQDHKTRLGFQARLVNVGLGKEDR